ncbi:MAG: hypothetical protein RLZZ428_111 [Pseudomonadota bacterium]
MTKEIIASFEELGKVSTYLEAHLPLHAIVFLRGDLAAGKTTLVQAIAKQKGVQGEVTSPTFSLQQCYGDTNTNVLFHYDLYRLEDDDFMGIGLFEEFEKEGWHLVEWGSDRLKAFFEGVGYAVVMIEIEPVSNGRKYTIQH